MVKVDQNGVDSDSKNANLGLRFFLPCFERRMQLDITDIANCNMIDDIIQSIKNKPICADIIEINKKKYDSVAKTIFPRYIYYKNEPSKIDVVPWFLIHI